ncbi:MAG: helix-turn-helix domain-containing protein [Verrucomicrobia bacterium]|nr:helix-turn-helix domain-containing protein [Verrucomicrobiota bacterium]
MKTKSKLLFANFPADYAGLCRILPPRRIHDNADYANVSEIADAMAGFEDRMNSDQHDYFDLLCGLLEEYDATRVHWPKVTGLDLLAHCLENHGLSASDLARILKVDRTLAGKILRSERRLTVDHIRVLAKHFDCDPGRFVDPA